MSKPITEKMLRHQADRCETAKHKRCKCRCGGEFHGVYHTEAWVASEVERDRLQQPRLPRQIDWVERAESELRA